MHRHRVTNDEYEKAVFHRDQELTCSKSYTRQLRQVKRVMTREVQTTKRVQQVYQRIFILQVKQQAAQRGNQAIR